MSDDAPVPQAFRLLDYGLLGKHIECKACGWMYFLGEGVQAMTPVEAGGLHRCGEPPPELEDAKAVVRRAARLCRDAEPHQRPWLPELGQQVCEHHLLEARRQLRAEGILR